MRQACESRTQRFTAVCANTSARNLAAAKLALNAGRLR
jgi:hypothetical protein